MNAAAPRRDLVLLGGGHAHVLALRQMAMQKPSGVRFTLVSESSHSPYSGMLPGLIAGHYRFEDTHIDLVRFCARLGVRFIQAQVTGLDIAAQEVLLEGRPRLEYDALSLNIGAQPDAASIPGAVTFATPVKPVAGLYRRWQDLERVLSTSNQAAPHKLVLVGGGAGSVELVLAMAHRLPAASVQFQLICGASLLEGYNSRAKRAVINCLRQQNIALTEHSRIVTVDEKSVVTAAGERVDYDSLLWSTSAVAIPWLRETGLPCDENGFLQVGDSLLVVGHDNIFAAGDVAVQINHPRPRAGVFAVRQAPVLAHNLVAHTTASPLREHRPQRRFLSLLSLGARRAVADRGPLWATGEWVWRWKNRIDQRFMARFSEVPAVMSNQATSEDTEMHCGGCGAKLPAGLLRDVLQTLAVSYPAVVDASRFNDDAAIVKTNPELLLVQSVDSLRQLSDDPWLMGRIAALHALSDIHAMGAVPHSCLAHITLPYGAPAIQHRDLGMLMSGAMSELQRVNCTLLGGHSLEGPELSIGFTINGQVEAQHLLAKLGASAGDQLILTKPLGTGVLFAALAQGGADGRWINAAMESMLQSNGAAAEIAQRLQAHACTDITGFGLLGHLQEMLPAANQVQGLQARLQLQAMPLLPGVEQAFSEGFASTLQPGNQQAVMDQLQIEPGCNEARLQSLFDPQTSGGLLLACAPDQSAVMLRDLHQAGFSHAAVIGKLAPLPAREMILKLQS